MVVQKHFIDLAEASEQRANSGYSRVTLSFYLERRDMVNKDAPESEIHEIHEIQNMLPQNWRRAVEPSLQMITEWLILETRLYCMVSHMGAPSVWQPICCANNEPP